MGHRAEELILARVGIPFPLDAADHAPGGYLLEVEIAAGPLRLLERRCEPPTGLQFGEAGQERLIFMADEDGTALIQLRWRRPWEAEVAIERWFRVEIAHGDSSPPLIPPADRR